MYQRANIIDEYVLFGVKRIVHRGAHCGAGEIAR
jgi:hypothetical protein